MSDQNFARLEAAIDYQFKDKKRLRRALTHASVQNASIGNYERLEFLGDRVLGLVISEILGTLFPDATEGELSVRLNTLVNADTCAEIAREIGLPRMIYLGTEMKSLDARRLSNIYADVIEALIAAIYLEGGLDAARLFIHRYWDMRARNSEGQRRDAKTELQEWAHKQKAAQPLYRILKRTGPDHDPMFEMEVRVSGFAPAAGHGSSKRTAERAAAENLLCREGVWVENNEAEPK